MKDLTAMVAPLSMRQFIGKTITMDYRLLDCCYVGSGSFHRKQLRMECHAMRHGSLQI